MWKAVKKPWNNRGVLAFFAFRGYECTHMTLWDWNWAFEFCLEGGHKNPPKEGLEMNC